MLVTYLKILRKTFRFNGLVFAKFLFKVAPFALENKETTENWKIVEILTKNKFLLIDSHGLKSQLIALSLHQIRILSIKKLLLIILMGKKYFKNNNFSGTFEIFERITYFIIWLIPLKILRYKWNVASTKKFLFQTNYCLKFILYSVVFVCFLDFQNFCDKLDSFILLVQNRLWR